MAQKSSRTTFPRKSLKETVFPDKSLSANAGAFSWADLSGRPQPAETLRTPAASNATTALSGLANQLVQHFLDVSFGVDADHLMLDLSALEE